MTLIATCGDSCTYFFLNWDHKTFELKFSYRAKLNSLIFSAFLFGEVCGLILSRPLTSADHQGFFDWESSWLADPVGSQEVTPLAAAHLLKFLGWAPSHVIPSELSHGHRNPLTNVKKRPDHVVVRRPLNSADLNQAPFWQFTHFFHIHSRSICIRYHIADHDSLVATGLPSGLFISHLTV